MTQSLIETIKAWLKDFNEENEEGPGISFFDAQEKAQQLQAILDAAQPSEIRDTLTDDEAIKALISGYCTDQFDNQDDNVGCCTESMQAAWAALKPLLKRESRQVESGKQQEDL